MAPPFRRAAPARAPHPSAEQVRADGELREVHREAERRERRSVVRGLILLALVVLILSMARAGWDRVFPSGWWRP